MLNRRISSRSSVTVPARVLLFALISGLTGCSEASSETAKEAAAAGEPGTVYDLALEDAPCDVVTKTIVAQTFSVSVDEIDVAPGLSDSCNYETEFDGKTLEVTTVVDVFESAEEAADSFRSVTAGMSTAEASKAVDGMNTQVTDGGVPPSQSEQRTTGSLVEGLGSGGLEFVEVEDLAKQARFGDRYGTLYLLHGNMRLNLSAYYGPSMSLPETISPQAIMDASEAWETETRPVRKRQSIELARAVLEGL